MACVWWAGPTLPRNWPFTSAAGGQHVAAMKNKHKTYPTSAQENRACSSRPVTQPALTLSFSHKTDVLSSTDDPPHTQHGAAMQAPPLRPVPPRIAPTNHLTPSLPSLTRDEGDIRGQEIQGI